MPVFVVVYKHLCHVKYLVYCTFWYRITTIWCATELVCGFHCRITCVVGKVKTCMLDLMRVQSDSFSESLQRKVQLLCIVCPPCMSQGYLCWSIPHNTESHTMSDTAADYRHITPLLIHKYLTNRASSVNNINRIGLPVKVQLSCVYVGSLTGRYTSEPQYCHAKNPYKVASCHTPSSK